MTVTTTQRAYLAFFAVCFFWGTTYLGIKVALETVPPFLIGGIPLHHRWQRSGDRPEALWSSVA